MTYRDFYNAVIAETQDEDVAKFAAEAIEKMDERNANRKPSKKQIENETVKEAIKAVLTDTPQTAKEIAEQVGISTQKASSLVRRIDGVETSEIRVKGSRPCNGYFLAE